MIIASLRRIYVEKHGLISEDDMLDITALAQSSPGAAAVNASILIGYRLGGTAGALISLSGTVLPPLLIMVLISSLYAVLRNFGWIGDMMSGMHAGVAAVILHTAVNMTAKSLSDRNLFRTGLFILSLCALLFTDLSGVVLIPAAALIASVPYIYKAFRR